MLDVERGDDVDSDGEDVLDVLPALRVPPAPGDVGVGEFIDQHHLRPPGQQRLPVQFGVPATAVLAGGQGQGLEPVEFRFGVPAPVALHEAGHHIRATGSPAVGLVEHPVRLADSGGRAQKHLEPAGGNDGPPRLRGGLSRDRHRQNFSGKNNARTR